MKLLHVCDHTGKLSIFGSTSMLSHAASVRFTTVACISCVTEQNFWFDVSISFYCQPSPKQSYRTVDAVVIIVEVIGAKLVHTTSTADKLDDGGNDIDSSI